MSFQKKKIIIYIYIYIDISLNGRKKNKKLADYILTAHVLYVANQKDEKVFLLLI